MNAWTKRNTCRDSYTEPGRDDYRMYSKSLRRIPKSGGWWVEISCVCASCEHSFGRHMSCPFKIRHTPTMPILTWVDPLGHCGLWTMAERYAKDTP